MKILRIKALPIILLPLAVSAQSIEGTRYMLPKNGMRFTVKVEKTVYASGRLCQYAERFLKERVPQQGSVTYRLLGLEMDETVMPDTAKQFTLITDKKHSIDKVTCSPDGQLLAINADAMTYSVPKREFTPAKKPAPLNPNDFMTEDILSAGSTAKMAELTAKEIYDIRDSRNSLSRGEADNLPKDGAQLALMYENMNRQENALSQLFYGTTVKDTAWTQIDFVPMKEGTTTLFRFSKHFGLVDADDLSGEPYSVSVTNEHTAATPQQAEDPKKEDKNDIGFRVNLPSKIKVVVSHDGQTDASYEITAAQFGNIQSLGGELFGKKQSSQIVLDPMTGSVKSIKAIEIK